MNASGLARSLRDLAEFTGGTIVGDEDAVITGVGSVEGARRGDITFAQDEKFLAEAAASPASCIIVPRQITECDKTILQVDNPRFAFARIATLFAPPRRVQPGVHPTAVIAPDAHLGPGVAIGAHAVVDAGAVIGPGVALFPGVYVGCNVRVGESSIIHANVVIEADTVVGAHCIIHGGTVVGSDGFGFVEHGGKHYKIPQIGNVVIEDNVEIGANCTIDRAASGSTIVHSGTKIDNLVHLAHNVVIGHDCLIIAQVGISGSVTVGDRCTLAGQAGVAGHIRIGDRTVVAAKAGVTKSQPGNMFISGFPAKPHLEEKRIMSSLPKVPELVKKVTQMTTALQRLARRLDRVEGGRS